MARLTLRVDRETGDVLTLDEWKARQEGRQKTQPKFVFDDKKRMRGSWIWNGTEWIDRANYRRPQSKAPAIHSDFADYVMCHADGKRYGSKGDYHRAIRAAGCEVVGNERLPEFKPKELPRPGHDIKRVLEERGL